MTQVLLSKAKCSVDTRSISLPINRGLSSSITQPSGEIDTSQSVNEYKASIVLSGEIPGEDV